MEDDKGFKGIFRGLGDLLQMASDFASTASNSAAPHAMRRGALLRPRGLHGVYGVSVRVCPPGAPSVARVGQVRSTPRDGVVINGAREPLADVFDEGDHYVVIVELPGVESSSVHWRIAGGTAVIIRADSSDRKYYKTLTLPGPIDDNATVSCYANGVLELKLWKPQQAK